MDRFATNLPLSPQLKEFCKSVCSNVGEVTAEMEVSSLLARSAMYQACCQQQTAILY